MKRKIAIESSPSKDGNSKRGVGFYTKRLIENMKQLVASEPAYSKLDLVEINHTDVKKENYDLLHYPYFDPYKLTLKQTSKPTIVTVHDLIPREFKKQFPAGIKGEIIWLLQKQKLLKSDLIITDSIYSKFSINKITGYPMDRIFSIPLAADPDFYQLTPKPSLDLPRRFVLYVGDINWNKNVPNLAKSCIRQQIPLIVVGKTAATDISDIPVHPWTQSLLELKTLQSKNPNYIITPGFIENSTLNKYYNLATCYCQPSYAEGFGLPLLEAMQTGCPVLYSNQSSLAEIANNIKTSFDPNKNGDLENKLQKILSSAKDRDESSKDGLERSKFFSWKITAIQTLETYLLLLKKHGNN